MRVTPAPSSSFHTLRSTRSTPSCNVLESICAGVDVREARQIVQRVRQTSDKLRLRALPHLGALLGRALAEILEIGSESQMAVLPNVQLGPLWLQSRRSRSTGVTRRVLRRRRLTRVGVERRS